MTIADNLKGTGVALEAHFQFLLWPGPTLQKLHKTQKFTLGDRIQNQALDILERTGEDGVRPCGSDPMP